jgi:hypothetical protein
VDVQPGAAEALLNPSSNADAANTTNVFFIISPFCRECRRFMVMR